MFPDAQLLQSHVVLEHLSEMDRHTLADSSVYWVVDVEFFEVVVARIQHWKDTDNSIVVNFVISKVERKKLIMCEKQLSHHHCSICLYLVVVEIKWLEIRAFFQSLCQVLCSLWFNVVSLQVQAHQPWALWDQITKSFRTNISNLIVAKVYLFDVDSVTFECCANNNEMIIGYAVGEDLLVVAWDDNIDVVVFIVCFFKVLHEGIVGL